MARSACPINSAHSIEHAEPLEITIDGNKLFANPKVPEAGKSLGWFANGKITLLIGGVAVDCQVGINVTCINSKS